MINFRNIKQASEQLWDNGEIYTRPFHFGASHWDIKPSERDAKQLAAISDPTERRAAIEQLVHNSIDRLQRERAKNMKNKVGFTVAGAYIGGPVGAIVGHSIDKNRVPSKRVLDKREAKYNKLMRDRYPEDRLKYQAAVEAAVARLRAGNKTAADYFTAIGLEKPIAVMPNKDEVAYLATRPDSEYQKEHTFNVQRVMEKIKEIRQDRMTKGWKATAPAYFRSLSPSDSPLKKDPIKEQARLDKIKADMNKWSEKKLPKIQSKYDTRLTKAVAKFKKKYGAGSKHPYTGQGKRINDIHTDMDYIPMFLGV